LFNESIQQSVLQIYPPLKVCSSIAQYPVLTTAQSTPGKPVQSDTIATSLGSI